MSKPYITILGKAVRAVARARGGGSALPGLFVERIDPHFIKNTLASLPRGVVVISGTNGKTTTTKMVVELLESQGLRVFTNRSGSNFTRGVAAALLGEIDLKGELHADIAVLELDEAHAVHFVRTIPPTHSLILNVMRDQLDRFGEIDVTADMLRTIVAATTDSVVLNREDQRIAALKDSLTARSLHYFGLSDDLLATFPSDDNLRGESKRLNLESADVVLTKFTGAIASFRIHDQDITTPLKLTGVYNVFNAAAALALVLSILGDEVNKKSLVAALAEVTPAFGRGETLTVDGQPLELVLVKNPSGFRLGLQSFNPKGYAIMIAINDNYADGRDMSWLWDVEFDSLRPGGVANIAGIRAFDMALRLQYDEIPFSYVEKDLEKALKRFISENKDKPKRIYCTYTAMLNLRKALGKITDVERIG